MRRSGPGAIVCWPLLLCAGLLCAGLLGASALQAQAPGGGQAAMPAASGDYVGSAACVTCHVQSARQHGKLGVECEECHGPGREHIQGNGDKSRIFNPTKGTAQEVDAKCLQCHASKHPNFDRSPHGKAGLSCVSCHSIHGGGDVEHSLKAAQPALCFQCHSALQPQFSMPFHHQVNEGVVKCTGCHDPHGAMQNARMRNTASQNATCTKCHAEQAGPFKFEHPVVKLEGCTSCHSPHGSQNAHLLNASNVNTLCLQCHPAASMAAAKTVAAHGQMPAKADCVSCHPKIHGSNVDRNFIK